jgi:uncharacterized protein
VIDAHVHIKGGEKGEDILRALDAVGLERIVLISTAPHYELGYPLLRATPTPERDAHGPVIDELARIVAADPERLVGFAWIEPTLEDAVPAVDYALGEKGLWGIKMIPTHWYPRDERAQACYARIETHRRPLLFHSGIMFGQNLTSEYCRPVFFEIMLHYPGVRFALSHIGWPWTDECFAVCGKFRAATEYDPTREWTSYVDLTSGAPRLWKVDALRKGLAYLGDGQMFYGSDSFYPENPEALRQHLTAERQMLREAGVGPEAAARLLGANAEKWLGIDRR